MPVPRLRDRSTTANPGRDVAILSSQLMGTPVPAYTAVEKAEAGLRMIREALPEMDNPDLRARLTMMLSVADHDPPSDDDD